MKKALAILLALLALALATCAMAETPVVRNGALAASLEGSLCSWSRGWSLDDLKIPSVGE